MYGLKTVSIVLCLCFLVPFPAWPEWTTIAPVTDRNLNGVTWIDSQFIAIGDFGTLIVSKDGSNWELKPTVISNNLYAVDGKDSIIIAGGDSGMALASINHGPWVAKKIGDTLKIQLIALSSKIILIGTKTASIYRYGKWDSLWTSSSSTFALFGLVWNGTQFLGMGKSNLLISSADGISWTGQTMNVVSLTSMALEGQTIFAPERNSGSIMQISRLSDRWNATTFCTLPVSLFGRTENAIAARNGYRYAVGDSGLAISFKNQYATVVEPVPTKRNLRGVAIGNSSAVIVGDSGLILVNQMIAPVRVAASIGPSGKTPFLKRFGIVAAMNGRLPAPHPGKWEITIFTLAGKKLTRKTVYSEGKSAYVAGAIGKKGIPRKNLLLYSLKELPTIRTGVKP